MSKFDYLSLGGNKLQTFLVVLQERSISRAADRLGVTQSAVSHTLEKLRLVLGDPLFVRSGRGVEPTERAISLEQPVQNLLDQLKNITDNRPFDPLVGSLDFTIAANDFQRDLIFPELLRQLDAEGVDIRVRFVPSGIPAIDLLNRARCQLIITPLPPDGADIFQTRLFQDEVVCFYDPAERPAPKTHEDFRIAEILEVQFDDDEHAMRALNETAGVELNERRVSVPNFAALAPFLRGSRMLTIQLSKMGRVNLQGFASCPVPNPGQPVPMYMVWHRRENGDPAHKWLRGRIFEATRRWREKG